jgi:hypothetical protein
MAHPPGGPVAHLHHFTGRQPPNEAEERLRAALASYDAASERLFRAAALVELAELAAERDDQQRCRELLGMAEPEARQMGLEPLLARCARLQRSPRLGPGDQWRTVQ